MSLFVLQLFTPFKNIGIHPGHFFLYQLFYYGQFLPLHSTLYHSSARTNKYRTQSFWFIPEHIAQSKAKQWISWSFFLFFLFSHKVSFTERTFMHFPGNNDITWKRNEQTKTARWLDFRTLSCGNESSSRVPLVFPSTPSENTWGSCDRVMWSCH